MKRAKLLVVEDEKEVLAYFRGSLEKKFDADIEAVDNGEEAVKIMIENDFDLVIMDIKMPSMSGIDVMKKVSEARKLQDVIVVTAYDSKDIAFEAEEAGALDYVAKPLNMEALLSKVKRILGDKGLSVEK
ncbi:MAG: response regulator [Candidatus Omnitrophica bacterium]|nr:response regulator [Candidatus Omnitrophota bacterium]